MASDPIGLLTEVDIKESDLSPLIGASTNKYDSFRVLTCSVGKVC
jgi:hypothetical protein